MYQHDMVTRSRTFAAGVGIAILELAALGGIVAFILLIADAVQ